MQLDSLELAFDALADEHDQMRWESEGSPFDAAVDEELWGIAGRELAPARALFLGAGSGREAVAFVEHGWRCELVDLSARMLHHAHHRLAGTPAVLHRTDARSFLATAREPYQFISMVGELLGYSDEPVDLLIAARRSLAQLGRLALTWVDAPSLVMTGYAVENGRDAGVVVVRERCNLSIKAWSGDKMQGYLDASALVKIKQVGPVARTPRRCWIVGPREA